MSGAGGLRAHVNKRLAHYELDVALECGPGRLLALVGPSGSGKTTVLRCVAGLETPDAGEISFGGEAWSRGRRMVRQVQERRVGLLSQDSLLFPHMTVIGNVAFALGRKNGRREKKDDPLRLLEEMGVAHLRERKPHEISGGERQRVALCQVLARQPRLLLLDEPFSALDIENRLALRELLMAVRESRGVPVVHVTHDLDDALAMADAIISLREGQEDPDWLQRQAGLLSAGEKRYGRGHSPKPFLQPSAPYAA